MARKKKNEPMEVYAIRKNGDGSITKKKFSIRIWNNLAPLTIVDKFGVAHTIPKQGFEQVPKGFGKKAPEPLNAATTQTDGKNDFDPAALMLKEAEEAAAKIVAEAEAKAKKIEEEAAAKVEADKDNEPAQTSSQGDAAKSTTNAKGQGAKK